MTDDSAGCFLKGHDCCRQRRLKGEELRAGCPAICYPFHVFWCENKRGEFKEKANLIQRCLSPNSCWKNRSANISWFCPTFVQIGWSRCCLAFWVQLMSRASVPDTRCQIVHLLREHADFWRSACSLTVSFTTLWCRNRRAAMWRDTGTLLFQTAAGMSMNLSASHLCHASAHSPSIPTHRPELMTASPHLHPIMTRMLRQLKMFIPIAKTLHVPQSGLFSLWWDC